MRWLALGLLAVLTSLAAVDGSAQAGARSATSRPTLPPLPAGTGLHVIPFPGTPDASARSPVIFSSLSPAEIRSVRVAGSRSGLHRGRLEALPAGAGTAFMPRRWFAPGEQVKVTAELRSPAAGAASGRPGATRLSFSFGVAIPGKPVAPRRVGALRGVAAGLHRSRAGAANGPPSRSFHSAPTLHPPEVAVSSDPDTASGDMFLTPGDIYGGGLMILNAHGKLVWYEPVGSSSQTMNLAVQSYQGQPVLTWWQGYPGEDVILNRSYRTVATVKAAAGYSTNLHDFVITPQGTAWLVATTTVSADLSSVGGPADGELRDYLVQEVDIKTGQLLWQWDCYGHIPLDASHLPIPQDGTPWDAFHLNSIQVLPDGDLLVSLRHTWSVYKISTRTGQIVWTLGGKYNQFKMGPGTQFEWQHDAQRVGNTLTLFDDGAAPQEQDERQSSAKQLDLQVGRKTVTLAHRYTHVPPRLTTAMGSMQILPDGNVFVGWGVQPDFSEYTPSGKQIFNGSFALGVNSYRAYRFPWTGHPATLPAIAAAATSINQTNVWASWNGATNVARWRVLGGPTRLTLVPLATQPDRSFETRIVLGSRPAYVEVEALGAHGRVLGTSAPQAVS